MITARPQKRQPKQPTKNRLRNIALYYLERFESSEDMLRQVLQRRIDKYAFANKDYDPEQAFLWAEEVIDECIKKNFINNERFAELKIKDYLKAGKPRRYIEQKMRQKGIDDKITAKFFEETEYSEDDAAFNFAQKKRIGCFRSDEEQRKENRQKDMGTLLRAGFDYEAVLKVLDAETGDN